MNIIICDSNEYDRSTCEKQVKAVAKQNDVSVMTICEKSGDQLLFEIEDYQKLPVDLIYMDVSLPGIDGMEVAARLRKMEIDADIVFFTNEKERMQEAFDVEAFHYIIKKDISVDKFNEIFLRAAKRAQKRNDDVLILSCAGEHRRISVSDIKYFEVQRRIVTVYYRDQSFQFYSTLSKIEEALFGKGFERIHASYLVNKRDIAEINSTGVKLINGVSLPISRTYYSSVRKKTSSSDKESV